MPKNECDPEDPMELVGVELPAQDESSVRDMALCFAEEFIRDGWRKERVLALFTNPFYRMPHAIWKSKGDDYVKAIVEEAAGIWGGKPEEKIL